MSRLLALNHLLQTEITRNQSCFPSSYQLEAYHDANVYKHINLLMYGIE